MKINYFHENKLFSYNVNFKARCKPVACFDSYKCMYCTNFIERNSYMILSFNITEHMDGLFRINIFF